MSFFYWRCSIRKGGVHLSKQKVTFWIEEGEVGLLKEKFNTDNQSETIRLAILQSLATGGYSRQNFRFCKWGYEVAIFRSGVSEIQRSFKGKDRATKQGNRRLQATIYFLAVQMIQVSSKGTPRHPAFRAYYEKRKAEGKTSQQALICISRRLISIIYGMLKSGTEYRMPVVEGSGEKK